MKEHPILMCRPMVRATMEDRKTNTRRVILPQPYEVKYDRAWIKTGFDELTLARCPYGLRGDHLWVRETFAPMIGGGYVYAADYSENRLKQKDGHGFWKPSIFMPRKASRITLEIIDIRVERVQDITNSDAYAEGLDRESVITPIGNFIRLWNFLNANRGYGWDVNPFVWVVVYRRLKSHV